MSTKRAMIGKQTSRQLSIWSAFLFSAFLILFAVSTTSGALYPTSSLGRTFPLLIGIMSLMLLGGDLNFFRYVYAQRVGKILASAFLVQGLTIALNWNIQDFFKLALSACIFLTIIYTVAGLSGKSIRLGIFIFSIAGSFLLFGVEDLWNRNTVGLYLSLLGLSFTACIGFRKGVINFKQAGVIIILVTTIQYHNGSRTATLSFLIANIIFLILYLKIFSFKTLNYLIFFLIGIIAFMPAVSSAAKEKMADVKGDDSTLLEFLLNDKDIDKILYDPFDRMEPWTAAVETIKTSPFIGIGYGKFLPAAFTGRYGLRAHNAYLEIGYQSGIFSMILWSLFYFLVYNNSFKFLNKGPLGYLYFVATVQILVYSLFESSGICSLGYAGNWMIISLMIHFMFTRRSKPLSRK